MHVPAGAMLFDDRQACEGFPFVVEGTVRVSKCAPSGRELPLYRVGPGETCIISSSCLLGHEDYNARGVTESDTLLMLLPKAGVRRADGRAPRSATSSSTSSPNASPT